MPESEEIPLAMLETLFWNQILRADSSALKIVETGDYGLKMRYLFARSHHGIVTLSHQPFCRTKQYFMFIWKRTPRSDSFANKMVESEIMVSR
mmetsp:Transcript_12298/g.26048  ORF Transcript_12298/g.26048 Transcript_12298/m.26048 type:complete len:93 (+) Transcript_12298:63-341(+)